MPKIEVIADAFENRFNFQSEYPYCYSNFQASINNEQSLVDKCIEEMIESEHPLVFDHNINVQCKYEPIQTNIHLIIDTDLLNLEVCLNA